MMEELIVKHCAPTLAGLKTANLINCHDKNAISDLEECTRNLSKKGIELTVLSERGNSYLIYVYRKNRLEADLNIDAAKEILKKFGYKSTDAEECIKHLSKRIAENSCFPHEIGLFLGYPVDDVKGFIEHKGQNFKCTGYWKVYCNECEAQKTFAQYKKCIDVYTRVYLEGSSIEKLAVAV